MIKPIAMRCNASQYEEIKPLLLQNGFDDSLVTQLNNYNCYLVNNNLGRDFKLNNLSNDSKSSFDRTVFETWNKDIFLEYCDIKPEFVLPKKWCVKITEENAQLLGDFWAKYSWEGYKEVFPGDFIGKFASSHNLSSKDSLFSKFPGSNYDLNTPNDEFPEITLEQFKTHVLKQNSQTMQTLTLGQLKDLYNVSDCSKWRENINYYLSTYLQRKDDFKVEIQTEHLQLLLKEGNTTQQTAVQNLGIKLSNPIEWDKIKTGSKVMLKYSGEKCVGSNDNIDFDKPFDVIFFKHPYYMFYISKVIEY